MPTIVDANCCSKAFSSPVDPNFLPVTKALLTGNATLVCGGRLHREYLLVSAATRILLQLDRAGYLQTLNHAAIDALEQQLIEKNSCISDDQHVIALAQLSGARLLCSHDKALHSDFQNKKLIDNPRGAIYQDKSHEHLIRTLGR